MSYCDPPESLTQVSVTFHWFSRGRTSVPPKDVVLHNLDLIERYVREFLGKSLTHEKAPLLDSGNTREVTVQPYGR